MRSESGYCDHLIISSHFLPPSPISWLGFTTHLLTIPILQKGIQHIHLLQFPLFVKDLRRRYRSLRSVGDHVICWISGGGGRGCEAVIDAVLDRLLEGDGGAEKVEGPLGEDTGVVFVNELRVCFVSMAM